MMLKFLSISFAGAMLVLPGSLAASGGASVTSSGVALVENGGAVGVVVSPQRPSKELTRILEQFVTTVEEATGAVLPIVKPGELATVDPSLARLWIAPREGNNATLPAESYEITVKGKEVTIRANPMPGEHPYNPALGATSQPLRWALNRLLTQQLGVRHLWPGKLGTYIPKSDRFLVPEGENSYQPKLLIRNFRLPMATYKGTKDEVYQTMEREAFDWLEDHQMGRRGKIRFGHAFTSWWDKYNEQHPDYFATPLPGMNSPVELPDHPGRSVKLRLSNPAVIEQIAKEYEAAGAPPFYNVCPNDGSGYDLTPETLAWDLPLQQPLEAIWRGVEPSKLTARYVTFWNKLHERLKAINPDVTLLSYAYSSYRLPPPPERPVTARLIIGIVDGWDAYDSWKGWRGAGAELFLRPNWGFASGGAPLLPIEEMHGFLQFASRNGMMGFDLDSVIGYWGSEGFIYYLIARTLEEPELSLERIVGEYSEAFGSAAPLIRDYLAYWQKKAKEFGPPSMAGGTTGPAKGRYHELQASGAISRNYLHGPLSALPHLYTPEVMAPAVAILENAEEQLRADEELPRERIAFLRNGLEMVSRSAELIALGQKMAAGGLSDEEIAAFEARDKELIRMRYRLDGTHVVWPRFLTYYENRYRVAIRPRNIEVKAASTQE